MQAMPRSPIHVGSCLSINGTIVVDQKAEFTQCALYESPQINKLIPFLAAHPHMILQKKHLVSPRKQPTNQASLHQRSSGHLTKSMGRVSDMASRHENADPQTGVKLTVLLPQAPRVLGLKTCATMPRFGYPFI